MSTTARPTWCVFKLDSGSQTEEFSWGSDESRLGGPRIALLMAGTLVSAQAILVGGFCALTQVIHGRADPSFGFWGAWMLIGGAILWGFTVKLHPRPRARLGLYLQYFLFLLGYSAAGLLAISIATATNFMIPLALILLFIGVLPRLFRLLLERAYPERYGELPPAPIGLFKH